MNKTIDISEEIKNLKKNLVLLRINKITKQKTERHQIKKVQHRIAQLLQLKNKTI